MQTTIESEISGILVKNPMEWTADEVQTVCDLFSNSVDKHGSCLNVSLVRKLWRHTFCCRENRAVFDDPDYELSLMNTARAFGEFVPGLSDKEKSLPSDVFPYPGRLNFGPGACMNSVSGPSLESAVMHVFVLGEAPHIEEILVAGIGTGEMRRKVRNAALACMLQTQAGDLDLYNADIYRIRAPSAEAAQFTIPGLTETQFGNDNEPHVSISPMVTFLQAMKSIEAQTGLVNVHHVSQSNYQQVVDEIRNCEQMVQQGAGGPCLIAKDRNRASWLSEMALLYPYNLLGRRFMPLHVILSPEILMLPSFEALVDAFKSSTVDHINADADLRKKSYLKGAEQLSKELERWNNSGEFDRKTLWDNEVVLTESFNNRLGLTVRLNPPHRVSREVYMKEHLPHLIRRYKEWARRMDQILQDIHETVSRPDSPIHRIAASRFIDAILRQKETELDETALVNACFRSWADQVGPYIRHAMHTFLNANEIPLSAIARRNTAFNTRFRIDELHQVTGLFVQPMAYFSPSHAVIIIDRRKTIVEIHDPVDHAIPRNEITLKNRRDFITELKRHYSDHEDLQTAIREMAVESPEQFLREITEYLGRPFERKCCKKETGAEEEYRNLLSRIMMVELPHLVAILHRFHALHTARELLDSYDLDMRYKAQHSLLRLFVECTTRGKSLSECIPRLFAKRYIQKDGNIRAIEHILNEAVMANRQLVTEFVSIVENSENGDLSRPFSFIMRNWMSIEEVLINTDTERLFKIMTVEQLLRIAALLELHGLQLRDFGETAATALFTLGRSLEEFLLTPAVKKSEAVSLVENLIGEKNVT